MLWIAPDCPFVHRALCEFRGQPDVQAAACKRLGYWCDPSPHIRKLIGQTPGFVVDINMAMKDCRDDANVQIEALGVFAWLAYNNEENAAAILRLEGVTDDVIWAMNRYRGNGTLQQTGCRLIMMLARSRCASEIDVRFVQCLRNAMAQFVYHDLLQRFACQAVVRLAKANPAAVEAARQHRIVVTVVTALARLTERPDVQEDSCRALAWLAALDDAIRDELRGQDQLLRMIDVARRGYGTFPGVKRWATRALAAITGQSPDPDAILWVGRVQSGEEQAHDDNAGLPPEVVGEAVTDAANLARRESTPTISSPAGSDPSWDSVSPAAPSPPSRPRALPQPVFRDRTGENRQLPLDAEMSLSASQVYAALVLPCRVDVQ